MTGKDTVQFGGLVGMIFTFVLHAGATRGKARRKAQGQSRGGPTFYLLGYSVLDGGPSSSGWS